MGDGKLEKTNKRAMFRCITAALQMTSRHARSVFTRISRIFSRLSCMNVNVVVNGRQFSRPLTEKEKALVIHEVERSLKSKKTKGDSLADEILSIRVIDAASVSSVTTLSGSESCESVDASGVSVKSASTSDTPSAESYVSVNTPVYETTTASCRAGMAGDVVSGMAGDVVSGMAGDVVNGMARDVVNGTASAVGSATGDAANNPPSVAGSVSMETVGDSVVGSLSPVSYYRSSADLRVDDSEGWDDTDDGFWDQQ